MDLNRKIAQHIGEHYIFETAPTIIYIHRYIIDDMPLTSPTISNVTTDNCRWVDF